MPDHRATVSARIALRQARPRELAGLRFTLQSLPSLAAAAPTGTALLDQLHRALAPSPDIADALALTFALPVTPGWDLPPVQEYCVTEYDLYRDFDEDYWDEKDEFDE